MQDNRGTALTTINMLGSTQIAPVSTYLPLMDVTDMTPTSLNPLLQDIMQKLALAQVRMQEQNARIAVLEQLVYVDDLTGLLNKRAFDDVITREFDRCTRGHSQGGLLVMIDLDNFKSINDSYGHGAGDMCLQVVAEALKENIRSMDAAARLGGDEFAVLLCNADKNEALNRIQTLAWKLNHLSFLWDDTTIAIRASVGVREFCGDEDPMMVLKDADASLYACKSFHKKRRKEYTAA